MDRWLKSLVLTSIAATLVWLATFEDRAVDAQVIINGRQIRNRGNRANPLQQAAGSEDDLIEGVFLPPDRTAKRRLELAKEMTESKRFGEAVRYLGSLLDSSEDYFFRPDAAESVFRSLKAESGRLIAALPPEGRESYELQFGAKARRMLDEASAAGDPAALAEVSRRFFYTKAGAEAGLLLARNHLDHGRPLAAALLLERLQATSDTAGKFEPMLSLYLASSWLRAGMPERAQVTLLAAKNQRPPVELRIAGKPARWFQDDSQALAWLSDKVGDRPAVPAADSGDDWLMYRGDARRNGTARGSRPLLNPRWRVRVAHHPEIEKRIEQLRSAYASQDLAALPSLHPLAVGNVVLMRNSRSLLAVDFETGKLIWEAEPFADDSFDQLIAMNSPTPQQPGQMSQQQRWLGQRIWDDPTYGTLTSDGDCIFFVEDLGSGLGSGPAVIMPRGQRQMASFPKTYNRLAARELKTEGKLKWEVGGPNGEDEPKLAEAFFLGPPLALQGRLYSMAEMKGQEIRLVVMSAKTGKLDWSQQLCVVEHFVTQDPERRSGGASPSFADGVLVCPTSAGAIVAVDLTSRSLLWGYQYPHSQQDKVNQLNVLRMGVFAGADKRIGDRWVEGMVTIADGRVLITPIESDQLHCLNLIDGEVKWKLDRESNLYVACVDAGHVILVGHNQMSAYSLTELDPKTNKPKAIWSFDLPAGSIPSGRGFYSEHRYFLPLSSAEVAEVDLTAGAIVSRAKSRSGEVPGNLICHHGEIISQSPDSVEAFYQLDSLKGEVTDKLRQSPDDPKSLARLGEIKLDEGKLAEAIELFRHSFELDPEDRTRDLLVDSLLDGLRADFAGSRAKAAELEKLIDQKHQRNTYLRLVAAGLKKTGESLPAFDHYMRLLDEPETEAKTEPQKSEPEAVDESLLVRRERWLQAELADLRLRATPEAQQQIDERIAQRLQVALDSKSPPELRRFLQVFGSHPLADKAREGLVTALAGGSLMEREMLLRRMERSPQAATSHGAVARLAALYDEARRPELAVIYYLQLSGPLADVVCLDNKTGKQLSDSLPADGPVRKQLAAAKPWPAGRVVPTKDGGPHTLSAAHHQRSFDLNIHGPAAPFFTDLHVALEPQQQTIVGEDGLGNERFRAVLHEAGSRRVYGWNGVNGFNNPALNFVSVNGNLLMLWMGHQVLAVDTLRGGEGGGRVLWSQDLNMHVPGVAVQQGLHQQPVNVPWGLPRFVARDLHGRLIGSMGPVKFDGVCFQRVRELICVDPLTGDVMWTRKNIPIGSDVFGDEELLFVVPPDGGEALVVRALDGELLGRRPVAAIEQRMTTVGRNVLVWSTSDDGKQVVGLRDAWTGKELWSQAFDAGAKGAIVDDDAVGVLEPSGRFVLARLSDGKKLVEDKLKPESALSGIYILGSASQYLLVTNSPATNVQASVNIQPAPGGLNNPIVNGWVYAFSRPKDDEPSRQLWPEPFEVKQQGLVLTQPSEVPLLFFLSHRHTANGVGQHETRTSVLALDKRNGQKVYANDDLKIVISNFEITADHQTDTVSLMLPNKTLTFRLTNDPLPTKEEQAQIGKKGILEAIGGAIQRAVDKQRLPNDLDTDDD